VSKFDDPHEACLSVVAESYRLWLQYETRTDDITMIMMQFVGLDQTPQQQAPMRYGTCYVTVTEHDERSRQPRQLLLVAWLVGWSAGGLLLTNNS